MPIISPTTPGEQRADLTACLAILKWPEAWMLPSLQL